MTDEEQQRSLANVHRVRTAYPVKFLQVLPYPHAADNVRLRVGQGAWRTLHVLDALVFVRTALGKQRKRRRMLF